MRNLSSERNDVFMIIAAKTNVASRHTTAKITIFLLTDIVPLSMPYA
jgi:hypothetical protein